MRSCKGNGIKVLCGMIHTTTYTGTGATVTLAAILAADANYALFNIQALRPKWVQMVTESGGGTARLGDKNTTVSYGLPIPAQAGMMLPPVYGHDSTYSFTSTYVYVPGGTIISLMFEA